MVCVLHKKDDFSMENVDSFVESHDCSRENHEFCDRSISWSGAPTTQSRAAEVAICIYNDEFCTKHDEFCIKNDGFCITNDGSF